jgi:hypothetical protein
MLAVEEGRVGVGAGVEVLAEHGQAAEVQVGGAVQVPWAVDTGHGQAAEAVRGQVPYLMQVRAMYRAVPHALEVGLQTEWRLTE